MLWLCLCFYFIHVCLESSWLVLTRVATCHDLQQGPEVGVCGRFGGKHLDRWWVLGGVSDRGDFSASCHVIIYGVRSSEDDASIPKDVKFVHLEMFKCLCGHLAKHEHDVDHAM